MKLNELMNRFPTLSLKRFCDETALCYQYVLKASKQPIPGVPYDAAAFNFEAVEKIIAKRDVKVESFDWETIVASMKVFAPISDVAEFVVGAKFTMRAAEGECVVVYRNENEAVDVSEIVFKDLTTCKVRVMSVDTFLHQSPRVITAK